MEETQHNTLLATHRLEVVDAELDVEGPGHGDEVQHGVGGASEGHHGHDSVLERGSRHDVLRLKVLYGPDQKSKKGYSKIRRKKEGRQIYIDFRCGAVWCELEKKKTAWTKRHWQTDRPDRATTATKPRAAVSKEDLQRQRISPR